MKANYEQQSAIFTKRKINKGGEILVGTSDIYESVCRKCFLENI